MVLFKGPGVASSWRLHEPPWHWDGFYRILRFKLYLVFKNVNFEKYKLFVSEFTGNFFVVSLNFAVDTIKGGRGRKNWKLKMTISVF